MFKEDKRLLLALFFISLIICFLPSWVEKTYTNVQDLWYITFGL